MRAAAPLAAGVGALLLVAGCSSNDATDQHPVRPAAVRLNGCEIPDSVHIGLVVTLKAPPGQGAQWLGNAAGAQVATYQYQLGGHPVTLDVVDDKGTPRGARAALGSLADRHVAGIVAATSGPHLTAALRAAAPADTPVLLPYETNAAELPATVWLTGPSRGQADAALTRALAENGWTRPFVISTAGQQPAGVQPAQSATVGAQSDGSALVGQVERAARSRTPFEAVVIAAPPETQARIVARLQGSRLQLPVVLSGDALSPVFASSLVTEGGTLAGQLTSVGIDADDVTAVGSSEAADRAAGFFSALRIEAGDPRARDLFGRAPFGSQAGAADIRSHDAVVALVRAAARAGSASPDQVLDALRGLHLTGSDGLAGPDLDFGAQSAVAEADVVPMHATSQDPSVRPAGLGGTSHLFWFAVPSTPAS